MIGAAGKPEDPMDISDPTKVFGRGGYWGRMFGNWLGGLTGNSTIKSLATSAFDKAGDYVASRIPGGDLIASGAEHLYKAVSGRGDYTMPDGSGSSLVPNFGGGTQDSVRVRSREYLGPVNGSAPLRIDELLINPGDQVTFPKLSKLAQHFQQYIMNGCIFYYKSTSGISTNSADTAIGQVIMATNYDSGEPVYSTKQDLMAAQYSNTGFPAQDIVHGIECAPFSNGSEVKRIRHGDSGDLKADPLNTDVGRFHLAVEGTNAAASRIGELWVTYDCTLIKSRDSKGGEVSSYAADHAVLGGILQAPTVLYNTLGITMSSNSIIFPKYVDPGLYAVTFVAKNGGSLTGGPNTLWNPPVLIPVNGCQVFQSAENFSIDVPGAVTYAPTNYSAVTFVRVLSLQTGTAPQVNISSGTIMHNSANMDMRVSICRVPDVFPTI